MKDCEASKGNGVDLGRDPEGREVKTGEGRGGARGGGTSPPPDAILWNEWGEVTESTIANLAVEREEGHWITPPLTSGLLAGVMRAHLLDLTLSEEGRRGETTLSPGVVSVTDLKRMVLEEGRRLVGFNALRGVFPMVLEEW